VSRYTLAIVPGEITGVAFYDSETEALMTGEMPLDAALPFATYYFTAYGRQLTLVRENSPYRVPLQFQVLADQFDVRVVRQSRVESLAVSEDDLRAGGWHVARTGSAAQLAERHLVLHKQVCRQW
jgi:hypothetical protein